MDALRTKEPRICIADTRGGGGGGAALKARAAFEAAHVLTTDAHRTAGRGSPSRSQAHTPIYAVAVSVAAPDALAVTSSGDIGLQVTTRQIVLRFSYRGSTMMVVPAVQPQQRATEAQSW